MAKKPRVPFNARVKEETRDAIVSLADALGLSQGEVVDAALSALKMERAQGRISSAASPIVTQEGKDDLAGDPTKWSSRSASQPVVKKGKKDEVFASNGDLADRDQRGAGVGKRTADRRCKSSVGVSGGRSLDASDLVVDRAATTPQSLCLICQKFLGKSTDAKFKPHMEWKDGRAHIECVDKK